MRDHRRVGIEWVDVEPPPPAAQPVSHRRGPARTAVVLAIVLAVVAAVLGIGLAGQESVVTGHGAVPPAPLGVLVNPDDPSSGSIVFGNTVDSATYPDAHEIVYVIGLRNTRTHPVHVARIVVDVADADRPNVIGARVIASSDSVMNAEQTPPAALNLIPPGNKAGLWVALRYRCDPHGVAHPPHLTVTITTDPHDSLQIGPDNGLVAPNDPARQFGCHTRAH